MQTSILFLRLFPSFRRSYLTELWLMQFCQFDYFILKYIRTCLVCSWLIWVLFPYFANKQSHIRVIHNVLYGTQPVINYHTVDIVSKFLNLTARSFVLIQIGLMVFMLICTSVHQVLLEQDFWGCSLFSIEAGVLRSVDHLTEDLSGTALLRNETSVERKDSSQNSFTKAPI